MNHLATGLPKVVGLGLILGKLTALLTGAPPSFATGTICAVAFGNSTGLPIVLLTVISQSAAFLAPYPWPVFGMFCVSSLFVTVNSFALKIKGCVEVSVIEIAALQSVVVRQVYEEAGPIAALARLLDAEPTPSMEHWFMAPWLNWGGGGGGCA